ncbi:MAG: YgfZ/GcvT domain-containing protein [Vicinamibacterales bacterium]
MTLIDANMVSLDGYWTLRNNAAAVRRSDRAVIVVTGRDRAAWLQGLLTNDVVALQEGQSCYSAYLTPQGRMITDMQVVALADRIWLDVPAPLASPLRDRLDGLIFAEDAQVIDASESIAPWGIYGPRAKVPEFQGSKVPGFQDASYRVPGLTLYVDADEPLPSELTELPEVSLDTLDVLRIEAGTPKFLVDMDESTIPLEAGIEDRAISFTKGCYVGQEVIVRVTHRGGGRVAKRLVRWRCQTPFQNLPSWAKVVPTHPVPDKPRIYAGNREIGRVTSAAFSPAENALIGLGYVHRDFAAAGTAIAVVTSTRIDAAIL